MKNVINILALLLAAVLMLGLCACGSDSAEETDSYGKGADATEAQSLWMTDMDFLKSSGYRCSLERSYLYQFEDVIHAEKNAIAAIVTVSKEEEGKLFTIYYLKTEEQAAACMKELDSNHFKQAGIRIVHGDYDNLIH